MEDFVKTFEEDLAPLIKRDKGSRQAMLFANAESNAIVAIAIYDTAEDVKASEAAFRDRASKVTPLLQAPPVANTYELKAQV